MRTKSAVMLLFLALTVAAGLLLAQDTAKTEATAQMPAMGPPEQMKQLAYVIGTWAVSGEMFMDPTSDNAMAFNATAEFEYALGNAAVIMHYSSSMMGMPFLGMSITTYDRELKEWQETWVDNMGARLMMMTGQEVDGKRVTQGIDRFMGQELLSKGTSWNITDTLFDWKMEQSTDKGKTWRTVMTATYTKKK